MASANRTEVRSSPTSFRSCAAVRRGNSKRFRPSGPSSWSRASSGPTGPSSNNALTGVFAPAHVVTALLLAVGWFSHPSSGRGLGWGLLAALLVGVAPYTWILYSVKCGRFVSRHIPDRAQRILPLAVAAAWVAAGVVLLALLGAPRELVALVIAMLASLAVTGVITTRWKVSLHTAVSAGAVTILTLTFGPALIATGLVVVAIGWSRVRRRDQTSAQVVVGLWWVPWWLPACSFHCVELNGGWAVAGDRR